MSTKIQEIRDFLQSCLSTYEQTQERLGRPKVYSNASMIIFFIVMMLKRIYAFKAMHKYVKEYYADFGFAQAPSRKTIRRRFIALPKILHWLMPQITKQCQELDYSTFRCAWTFIDKSVFRALGGVWHKKHRLQGWVPHPSIDTDASWAKSAYHGWRFGYGLHLICLENRFPIAACVTTASVKDYSLVNQLIEYIEGSLKSVIGILVGDAGYRNFKVIKNLHEEFKILLQTPKAFTSYLKNTFVKNYNALIQTVHAKWLYRKRKPSVEPAFSIIKQLFDLNGEKQLPYRGIHKVSSFLLICPLTIQLMMRDNFLNNRAWASSLYFCKALLHKELNKNESRA